jgi:hypothetical protein
MGCIVVDVSGVDGVATVLVSVRVIFRKRSGSVGVSRPRPVVCGLGL